MDNSTRNHFNSHQFINKKTLSLFILTFLFTACGRSSSENSTTEGEKKAIPKKEKAKVENKKEGTKAETLKAKLEVNKSLSDAKIKALERWQHERV